MLPFEKEIQGSRATPSTCESSSSKFYVLTVILIIFGIKNCYKTTSSINNFTVVWSIRADECTSISPSWENYSLSRGTVLGFFAHHSRQYLQNSRTSLQSAIPARKSPIIHISTSEGSSMNDPQSMAFSG